MRTARDPRSLGYRAGPNDGSSSVGRRGADRTVILDGRTVTPGSHREIVADAHPGRGRLEKPRTSRAERRLTEWGVEARKQKDHGMPAATFSDVTHLVAELALVPPPSAAAFSATPP
jgi:hypothetical protein